jgi:hypothetical protein
MIVCERGHGSKDGPPRLDVWELYRPSYAERTSSLHVQPMVDWVVSTVHNRPGSRAEFLPRGSTCMTGSPRRNRRVAAASGVQEAEREHGLKPKEPESRAGAQVAAGPVWHDGREHFADRRE